MSPTRRISRGTCVLCHEPLAKRSVAPHLAACLARHPAGRSVPGFHLLVEGGAPQYWMHLAARADAKLGDLDDFLRTAWLECCDHLSEFTLARRGDDIGMRTKLGNALRPEMTFFYAYDFGSTTELTLRVVAKMADMPAGKAIQLLALNDAPSYPCSACGKPAQLIDTEDGQLLCKACTSEHADNDMLLPLVNSPRTGVCGYSGPTIHVPTRKAGSM
jgi:hypothetical protein